MNLFHKIKASYAPFRLRAQFFLQNKLTKKKYLFLAFSLLYVPMFAYYTHKYPQETSLLISKGAEKFSDTQIPQFARNLIFSTYAKVYGVNREQMLKDFQQYKSFSQFFTRKIKARNICTQLSAVVSPSDSRILSFGQISQNSVLVVKGYSYSLGHLLCGDEVEFTRQDIDNMKRNKNNKLYHVVLYLAPGDYHRFHASSQFQVVRRKAIKGALFPVNQKYLVQRAKVYEKNARLILHGKWDQGYFGMVLVGALNVGKIVVKEKTNYKIGQEIGYFNLGSTIVLLFESPAIQWKIQEKQIIKYGQILAKPSKTQQT